MEFLLSEGAEVNIQNKDGFTALMIAAEKGNINIARSLLERFADPNIKDAGGITALEISTYRQNDEMINLLTAYGAK